MKSLTKKVKKKWKRLHQKRVKKVKKSRKKVLTKGVCFGIINERQAKAKRKTKHHKKSSKKFKKVLDLRVDKVV